MSFGEARVTVSLVLIICLKLLNQMPSRGIIAGYSVTHGPVARNNDRKDGPSAFLFIETARIDVVIPAPLRWYTPRRRMLLSPEVISESTYRLPTQSMTDISIAFRATMVPRGVSIFEESNCHFTVYFLNLNASFTPAHFLPHIFCVDPTHFICKRSEHFPRRAFTLTHFPGGKAGMSAFRHIAENASKCVHLRWQIFCVAENVQ